MEQSTQNVNVENQNMGKTTTVHGLQDVTMRGLQRLGTETTISCSLASPAGGYNRGNDLSISLSLYTVTLYINIRNTTSTTHSHNNKVSLSHIYTNMTFGIFTNIAPESSMDIYLHTCPFHWRRGSHRAYNIWFFSFPIRRGSAYLFFIVTLFKPR